MDRQAREARQGWGVQQVWEVHQLWDLRLVLDLGPDRATHRLMADLEARLDHHSTATTVRRVHKVLQARLRSSTAVGRPRAGTMQVEVEGIIRGRAGMAGGTSVME